MSIDGVERRVEFVLQQQERRRQRDEAEARMRARRDKPPEGYAPPTSAEELRERLARGERHFAKAQLAEASLAGLDLQESSFAHANLRDADLTGAKLIRRALDGADFTNAKLSSADLSGAQLFEAQFDRADMTATILRGTVVRGARLATAANVEKIDWRGACLDDVDLEGLMLKGANFDEAQAPRARLSGCDLTGATFRGAVLDSASVGEVDLANADLRGVKHFEFDGNRILNARLSPKSKDTWSVLRREYTGSRFAFHLLILVVFLLPYVARASFWIEVNRTQMLTESARQWISQQLKLHAPDLGQQPLLTSLTTRCLHPTCRSWHVWELLIGRDRAWYSTLLAIALLFYSSIRIYLTYRVGSMRDDEERTNVTPAYADYQSLKCTGRSRGDGRRGRR